MSVRSIPLELERSEGPLELTTVNIAMMVGGVVALAGYAGYILVPAWNSYGRIWERLAASFLTLFILVSLLGIGLTIGLSIVWFYDSYA